MGQLTLGLVCKEMIHFGHGAVEGHNIETVVGSVENQILAHDGQANKAKVTSSHIVSIWRRMSGVRQAPRWSANIDASEAHAGEGRED